MFEARMAQAGVLKKIVDAVKELVTECNFDVSPSGVSLQAMDSSHVCLVALSINGESLDHFRCDRNCSLGINMTNLAKILKCAANDDNVTLRADDNGDALTLIFASPKDDRVSDFDLKLMSIDSEHLGIPDQEYSAEVHLPCQEYVRVVKDLASIGDTVLISATKDGVKFSTSGDVGTANVTIRQNNSAEKQSDQTLIDLREPVALTFALRYLNNFAKAASLSPVVKLGLTKDLPVCVEFGFEIGSIKYFLAPKIEDEEMAADEGEDQ